MKILYIYDIPNWAIHRVGLLWLKNNGAIVDFKQFNHVKKEDYIKYDYIWVGFSRLYFKIPRPNLKKTIIAVHDPSELFAPHKFWKKSIIPITLNLKIWYNFITRFFVRRANFMLCKKAENIIVVSKEMKDLLKKYNVTAQIINTTSDLSAIENPIKKNINIISIANNHVRKNFPFMKNISNFCKAENIEFRLKGANILSTKKYIELLDEYSVYVCTSYQEGGPIPPMDAMARGLVVITTPVGQMTEIIKNGKNGFICDNIQDFKKYILMIKNDKKLFYKIQKESLKTIKLRSQKEIRKQSRKYLNKLKNLK